MMDKKTKKKKPVMHTSRDFEMYQMYGDPDGE